jgi:hypothetical protein
MTDNGGGWTLMLKVAGDSTTFASTSPTWTSAAPFGTTSTDLSRTEAKFQGFMNMAFTEVMLAFDSATPPATPAPNYAPFTLPNSHPSLLAVFSTAGPTLVMGSGTAAVRSEMLGLNPNFALEANCNEAGFNLPGVLGTTARFGIVANDALNCFTNKSSLGIGAAHNFLCGYSRTGPTAVSGNNCSTGTCGMCQTGAGTAPSMDPNIIRTFGYLFVR